VYAIVTRGNLELMGYKLLGFTIWQSSKRIARRRFLANRQKIATSTVASVVMAGVIAGVLAARQSSQPR
jgi:hypothetical protein